MLLDIQGWNYIDEQLRGHMLLFSTEKKKRKTMFLARDYITMFQSHGVITLFLVRLTNSKNRVLKEIFYLLEKTNGLIRPIRASTCVVQVISCIQQMVHRKRIKFYNHNLSLLVGHAIVVKQYETCVKSYIIRWETKACDFS